LLKQKALVKVKELTGKQIARDIRDNLKEIISGSNIEPKIAAVIFGDDEGSVLYARSKARTAKKIGIELEIKQFPVDITTKKAKQIIVDLSEDPQIHGIIIEEPIPSGIDTYSLRESIAPNKDIDCANPINLGRILSGNPLYLPATPASILKLLEHYDIKTEGKEVVIVGRSRTVGLPMANLLLRKSEFGNATVTVCHSRTKDLANITRKADILIVSAGKAGLINKNHVSEKSVIIDVGINYVDNKVVGDVDFDQVKDICEAITPVPGGIGPITVSCLLENGYMASNYDE